MANCPLRNESNIDRTIRIILGIILLVLGIFVYKRTTAIILDVIGAIALLTGLTGFCGIYRLFGISTRK
ncbi:MAG: YgaP family membrane protein [Caldisericaceae bacterium]